MEKRKDKKIGIKIGISLVTTKHSLHLLEVDDEGLDQTDRKLLRMMIENYGGGPVGIKTIAVK